MSDSEQADHFEHLQSQAKRLGISVVEMLLMRSELWCAIQLNNNHFVKHGATWVWAGEE